MRVPRVRAGGPVAPGERIDLPPEEARHLRIVLRRRPGDPVVILSPSGAFSGEIAGTPGGGPRVAVIAGERIEAPEAPGASWTVACGVTRGESFDLAIRMAAELGLEAVLPLLTRRTVVRDAGPGKRRRWERIAAEAGKQCGRVQPLEVLEPMSLADLVEDRGGEVGTGARPGAWIALPGEALPARALLEGSAGGRAIFLVGPEGGFAPEEADLAEARGFRRIGFPCPVLRTPTAVALIGALGIVLRGLEGDGR